MDSKTRAKKAVEERLRDVANTASKNNHSVTFADGQKSITTPNLTNFSENPSAKTSIHGLVGYDNATSHVTITLPGFERSSLEDIAGSVYSPDLTKIDDVKNPNIQNQSTVSEFEKAKAQYEGGIRYNELIGWANKYAGSQFKSLAEKAKSFSAGLASQSEIEKVYQQFLELQKQQKITAEKGVDYLAQAHKTATKQAALPYTIAENEAALTKQKSKAEKAFHEAQNSVAETKAFIANLGSGK